MEISNNKTSFSKIKAQFNSFLTKTKIWIKTNPKYAFAVLIAIILVYQGVTRLLPKPPQNKNSTQTVTTVLVEQKDFPVVIETTGNTISSNIVDIRPQVTNIVAKVHIKEGQDVKAGDLLFTLDDRADRANYEKAKALAEDAQRQAKRSLDLLGQKFISQAAVDTAVANANSAVAAARAAEVQLSYDSIRSPISGTTGVINVFPGSLVQPGNTIATTTTATTTSAIGALVTITQLNPMNVQFTIPEQSIAGLNEQMKDPKGLPIEISFANGKTKVGKVIVIDNQVDMSIGAVKVKGQLDNADRSLLPGQFVQISLPSSILKDALVVPSQSIVSNAQGKNIYVVETENTVNLKPVKVIAEAAGFAAITGVDAKARIVVEGKQNLRPGVKVQEAKKSTEAEQKK